MKNEPISQWDGKDHCHSTIEESISELVREVSVRYRCFDRWVAEGKISYVDARDRMERLLSAIDHLERHAKHMEKLADLQDGTDQYTGSVPNKA